MENQVSVKGDTYPLKEQLKQCGFHWNPSEKTWVGEERLLAGFRSNLVNGDLLTQVGAGLWVLRVADSRRVRVKAYTRSAPQPANCDNCGAPNGGRFERVDSSGLSGRVCGRCLHSRREELSFA